MDGCEALKPLSGTRREGLEELHTGADKGITPGGSGRLKHTDQSGARGLSFRGLVGMPLDGTATLPGAADAEIVAVVVNDHVLLGASGEMRGPTVDVQRTKMAEDLLLALEANVLEILVAEDEGATLGGHECELIVPLLGVLRNLDAVDFSADIGREVDNLTCGGKEVGESRVGVVARIECSNSSISSTFSRGS